MSTGNRLAAEAQRQLKDLIHGREVKLGTIARIFFMQHIFHMLPNTSINPVRAAAEIALRDIERRASALQAQRRSGKAPFRTKAEVSG